LSNIFIDKFDFLYFIFTSFINFFEKHQSFGEAIGIKYKTSDNWDTNRISTKLAVFQNSLFVRLTGFEFKVGDIDFIKSFRKRQKNPKMDFKIEIAHGKKNLRELEDEIVRLWHSQLKECYDLPIKDDEAMIEVMILFRKIIRESGGNRLYGFFRFWKNRKILSKMNNAMSGMIDEEKMLYFVPFLTTVDTFMISLSFKTFGDDLSDFFDRVPVRFVPFVEDGNYVICRLVNNGRNHPGNSVFGETTPVGPGSNVTTQILKAIRDFCNNNTWDVEGTPIQSTNSIAAITNLDEVSIHIYEQTMSTVNE